jgi:hypothetical protein
MDRILDTVAGVLLAACFVLVIYRHGVVRRRISLKAVLRVE